MLTTVETEHFKVDHMVWNKALQITFRQWGLHCQKVNFQENALKIGKPAQNLSVSTRMHDLAAIQPRGLPSTGGVLQLLGRGWLKKLPEMFNLLWIWVGLTPKGQSWVCRDANYGLATVGAKAEAGRVTEGIILNVLVFSSGDCWVLHLAYVCLFPNQ